MSEISPTEAAQRHLEVFERGKHLFNQLNLRDVDSPAGHHAIEMDVRPEFANVRGALQGGLIAVLVDIVAGTLAFNLVADNEASTATTDLKVHYLSPIIDGPARAEAWVVRQGRRFMVLQVEVSDVGRGRLAAVSTITFQVLPNRPGLVTKKIAPNSSGDL